MILTGKSLLARIKRTTRVLLVLIALSIIGKLAIIGLSTGIALIYFIFSGGNGEGLGRLITLVFLPIFGFISGVLVFGGAMATFSAILTSSKLWFKAIVITGVIGGAITVMVPAIQQWLWQQDITILKFVGGDNSEKLEPMAIDFVRHNETIIKEVGSISNAYLVGAELKKNGSVNYYDIGVDGTKTIYAIVEVSETNGKSGFSLACTTNLYTGQRDPYKHPCEQ